MADEISLTEDEKDLTLEAILSGFFGGQQTQHSNGPGIPPNSGRQLNTNIFKTVRAYLPSELRPLLNVYTGNKVIALKSALDDNAKQADIISQKKDQITAQLTAAQALIIS